MIRPGIWRRELTVPLQSIQAELNRLFEEYWQPPVGSAFAPGQAQPHDSQVEPTDVASTAWTPAIDFWESTNELTLVVDLPGVDPSSIDLSLAGNVLSLRGEKSTSAPNAGSTSGPAAPITAKGRVKERTAGSFHRQITLVEEVDFDRVEAQAKDGVLTVKLPKRAPAEARTIPIVPSKA